MVGDRQVAGVVQNLCRMCVLEPLDNRTKMRAGRMNITLGGFDTGVSK